MGAINQGREDNQCQNENDFNYENTQGIGVSNIPCQDETSESTDIAMSTQKLDHIEKSENIQVAIQEQSLSSDEEDNHVINNC